MTRIIMFLIAGLFGVTALAGCAESVIKDDELTAAIQQQYEDQTGLGLKSIECDETKAESGEAISCRATNDNDVDLEIGGAVAGKDESSDKWNFEWKVDKAYAPGDLFEDPAARALSAKLGFKVESLDCPDGIEVASGIEVHCEATAADGSSSAVTITLTDSAGNFEVAVDPNQS